MRVISPVGKRMGGMVVKEMLGSLLCFNSDIMIGITEDIDTPKSVESVSEW